MPLIALLTDYGLSDHYVGVVKAVIKACARDAEFIDISHGIAPYDIRDGAFVLLQASRYLPKGCVVLAVVDPGVNTKRLAIAVKTRVRVYVGPDNGLMFPAASHEGILGVYDIGRGPQVLSPDGTFAGRDVFAPAAALASSGTPLGKLGKKVSGMAVLQLPSAKFEEGSIEGTVLHVDHFGNAVTNIDSGSFQEWRRRESDFRLKTLGGARPIRFVSSYQEIRGLGVMVGSGGTMEISKRQGGSPTVMRAGETFSIVSLLRIAH